MHTQPSTARSTNGPTLDRDAVAVSYIPTGGDYGERRRWVDPSENFVADSVASDLERKIAEVTDDAKLEYENESAHSPPGAPSREVRQTALGVDATVLFVGAANDGQVTVPIDDADEFDVHVVRRS